MDDGIVTAIGIAAGALTTGSWIPQVVKLFRSRSAGDFSWLYLTAFTLGVATWFGYGILKGDLAVTVANGVTLVLLLGVLYIKLRHG